MTTAIVDTTVIIHLFRKHANALAWFTTIPDPLRVTPISWMEVMDGAGSKKNQATCKTILNAFDIVYPTQTDIQWAMNQLEKYRLSDGIGMNDCLIASVAHRLQVPLYTHNIKHFSVLLGSSYTVKPYTY